MLATVDRTDTFQEWGCCSTVFYRWQFPLPRRGHFLYERLRSNLPDEKTDYRFHVAQAVGSMRLATVTQVI